jgi:hypothetical protein
MNDTTKKIIPHIIALVLMFGLSCLFFSSYVFDGKTVNQFDNVQAKGMQGEIQKYKSEEGETILWTNAAFGGMPTYQVYLPSKNNMMNYPYRASLLYQPITAPHNVAFLGMFCMYLLLMVLKVDWRLALGGAVAMGICNYNMDLYIAGHSTKLLALAYLSAIMAGVILIFQKRWLLGGAIYGMFFSFQLLANHLQITYYTGLLVGIYVLINLVYSFIDEKEDLMDNLKSIGILVAFSVLAFSTSLPKTWTTNEYSKESQRGTSELAAKEGKDGLDKGYGMSYSLGFMEALLPSFSANYYGGGKEHNTIEKTDIYKNYGAQLSASIQKQNNLSQADADLETKKYLANFMYTGNSFTPGVSIYFGAIAWFLFIVGLILAKGKEKWWLAASTLFMFTISMGENFFLNGILFDYFPMFNKFRAMSMAMGLTQLTLIGLAFYGAQKMFTKEISIEKRKKALYIAGGIVAGILLLMLMSTGVSTFADAAKDQSLSRMFGGDPSIINTLIDDRKGLRSSDVLRSLFFVVFVGGLIWAYLNNKLRSVIAIVGISLLTMIDVWMVAKRVASNDKFKDKTEVANEVAEQEVDKQIKQDPDLHYRVLDLSNRQQGPFGDARASYYHKSVGGYFAAKMMIFEELKTKYLNNATAHRNILGMLNTKYIISAPQGDDSRLMPFPVQEACGNAWFVKDYQMVANADEELNGLAGLDTKNKALIQNQEADYMAGFKMNYDSTASIKLISYHPDRMEYTYSAKTEQLAMFSEMFYKPSKGWNVYLNDEQIDPFIKANFAIRAMRLPAGQNQVLEMRFEPSSYYIGSKIALVTSLLLLIGFVAAIVLYFKNNNLFDPTRIENEPLPEKEVKAKVQPTKSKTTKAEDKKKDKKKRKR